MSSDEPTTTASSSSIGVDGQKIFASGLFCIHVGPERTPFHVHSRVLEKSSKVLAHFVEASFQEGVEKQATLEDIDPDTFTRVVEFMYIGDYSEAEPLDMPIYGVTGELISRPPVRIEPSKEKSNDEDNDKDSEDNDEGNDEGNGEDNGEENGEDNYEDDNEDNNEGNDEDDDESNDENYEASSDESNAASDDESEQGSTQTVDCSTDGVWQDGVKWFTASTVNRTKLREAFEQKWHFAETQEQAWKDEQRFRQSWRPFTNGKYTIGRDDADFTPVFLCHAQLYVFANRYSMPKLGKLALLRLGATLNVFRADAASVHDIVPLLKYTYENTQDLEQGIDKLRHLVLDYCTWAIKVLLLDADFEALLEAGGALAKDIAWSLARFA